jgi:hypothetical protein
MEHDISETPIPPRARDLSFYVVLFFMVIPLWSSVPLSWAFVIRSLFFENLSAHSFFSRTLFAIAACEVRPLIFTTILATYFHASKGRL